jgi:MoaA/NifB/PqqE/SkfB family radical SAM enzyme
MDSPSISADTPAEEKPYFNCPAGYSTANVDENGDVFLCHNFMKRDQIKLCSIYDEIALTKHFYQCREAVCECPLYKFDLGLYRRASVSIGEPVAQEAADADPPPYNVWLHWVVTQECFLSCEYCGVGQLPFHKRNIKPIQIEKMMAAFDRSGLTYRVSFTGGGEPFAVPNLVEACVEITRNHYISLNTNLVRDMQRFAQEVDPSKVVSIIASLHLRELERTKNIDRYIKNFVACRDAGMPIYATAVGIPSIIPDLPRYREIFGAAGIEIGFATYMGPYDGKAYPDGYTDEELAAFGFDTFAQEIYKIDKTEHAVG